MLCIKTLAVLQAGWLKNAGSIPGGDPLLSATAFSPHRGPRPTQAPFRHEALNSGVNRQEQVATRSSERNAHSHPYIICGRLIRCDTVRSGWIRDVSEERTASHSRTKYRPTFLLHAGQCPSDCMAWGSWKLPPWWPRVSPSVPQVPIGRTARIRCHSILQGRGSATVFWFSRMHGLWGDRT